MDTIVWLVLVMMNIVEVIEYDSTSNTCGTDGRGQVAKRSDITIVGAGGAATRRPVVLRINVFQNTIIP